MNTLEKFLKKIKLKMILTLILVSKEKKKQKRLKPHLKTIKVLLHPVQAAAVQILDRTSLKKTRRMRRFVVRS